MPEKEHIKELVVWTERVHIMEQRGAREVIQRGASGVDREGTHSGAVKCQRRDT